MKYISIFFITGFLMSTCGPVGKTNITASKDTVLEDIDSGYIQPGSGYSSYFVDMYLRLRSLKPNIERYQLYGYNGFFYCFFAKEPRYIICLTYEYEQLSYAEKSILRYKLGEGEQRKFYHPDDLPTSALVNKFDKIDIVSNSDFNEIPAGESLASKFEFFSSTAWPIFQANDNAEIRIKDTDFHKIFEYYPFNYLFEPIHKDVSNLTPDDLYLLYSFVGDREHMSACLMAKEVPEIKEHIFTISYYEGDKVWSVDIPAVFEPYIPEAYREQYGL